MPHRELRLNTMTIPIYLKSMAVLFTLAIGLPLLFAPLGWAKLMRWQLPAELDLTNYFGRCLGAVVTAISVTYFRFAENAALHHLMLELLLAAFGLMVFVHVWGAIRRTQPWTETAEIPVYFLLSAAAAAFRWGYI